MDARILAWLEANRGKLFASPRSEVFGRRTEDFEIVSIKSDRVYIRFAGTSHVALPLIFSMFDRVLDCLQKNQGKPVRLGAKVSPPYENDTLEAAIWTKPFPAGLNIVFSKLLQPISNLELINWEDIRIKFHSKCSYSTRVLVTKIGKLGQIPNHQLTLGRKNLRNSFLQHSQSV